MSQGLEQHHPRRHRHVQTIYMPFHRDSGLKITAFAHQPAHPRPLSAEYDRNGKREIHFIVRLLRIGRER